MTTMRNVTPRPWADLFITFIVGCVRLTAWSLVAMGLIIGLIIGGLGLIILHMTRDPNGQSLVQKLRGLV